MTHALRHTIIASCLVSIAPAAAAADRTWLCISNFWQEPTCWSGATRPTAADNAFVSPVAGRDTVLNISLASGTALANVLRVDSTIPATVRIKQTGGTLAVTDKSYVGYSGTGYYEESGGTFTTNWLQLGYNVGSLGEFTLSGAGSLTALVEEVGAKGTGHFVQTGGTNTAGNATTGYLAVGVYGPGSYALSGAGILHAGTIDIGVGATGTFTQSGGTNRVTNMLYVGYGNVGSYALSGNGALAADQEYVGGSASGAFEQSGGTNQAGELVLGVAASGTGTYALSAAGSADFQSAFIGYKGTGHLTQSGTSSFAAHDLEVGFQGTGDVVQSSGSVTVGTRLNLGSQATGSGSYTLSGTGTLVAPLEYVGGYGSALFHQLGGTHTVAGALTLAAATGSHGTYELDGGTLSVGSLVRGSGAAAFDWTAGTLALTDSGLALGAGSLLGYELTLGAGKNLSVSGNVTSASGGTALHLAGGTLSVGGGNGAINVEAFTLGWAGAADYVLGGTGSITTSLFRIGDLGGTFTENGGALAAAQSEIDRGAFVQNSGTHTASDLQIGKTPGFEARYTLAGGTLETYYTTLGSAAQGTGRFVQSGGEHVAINALVLGGVTGSAGSYDLRGDGTLSAGLVAVGLAGDGAFIQQGTSVATTPTLDVGAAYIGTYLLQGDAALNTSVTEVGDAGDGEFAQTSGTHTVTYELFLGGARGHSGTYRLGGTGLLRASSEAIGLSGAGLFIQTGGTNEVAQVLDVGPSAGGQGEYRISGGMLHAATLNVNAAGRVLLDGGTVVAGTLTQRGLMQVNSLTTGDSRIEGDVTLEPFGTTTIASGRLLFDAGTLYTKANLATGTSLGGAGTLAIGSTGVLSGQGVIATNVENAGSVQAKSGNLLLSGAHFTNTGLVRNGAGANLFVEAADVSNLGDLQVNSGGAIVFDAALGNAAGRTVSLLGGTLATPRLTNAGGGRVTGFGTLTGALENAGTLDFFGPTNVTGALHNAASGSVLIENDQTLVVGTTVNDGRIETVRGTAVFHGGLVNNGVYVSDPSTSYFTDLVVNDPGYIVAGAGDRYLVSGAFANHSLQAGRWDTREATLVLNGNGPQHVALAGADLGAAVAGYAENFAWGGLSVGQGVQVTFEDGNAQSGAALYLGALDLAGGVDVEHLLVAQFFGLANVYYDPRLPVNAYLQGLTYSFADGLGRLAPAAVPLPPSVWLLLGGVTGLLLRPRRRHWRGARFAGR